MITGYETKWIRMPGRPMDMDWVRDIDKQCRDFGMPHFFKQYFDDGGNFREDGLEWSRRESNPLPLHCERSALPNELRPLAWCAKLDAGCHFRMGGIARLGRHRMAPLSGFEADTALVGGFLLVPT